MSHAGQPPDSGHAPQATPDTSPPVPPPGYETRDADVFRVVLVGLGLGLLILSVTALVFVYMLVLWQTQSYAEFSRPSDLRPAGRFEAVLPSNQELMREAQEKVEREMLRSYGWIDRDRQIARIPIGRAIEIVSRQGQLPTFPAEAAAAEEERSEVQTNEGDSVQAEENDEGQ
jgi:hypothetical protein